MNDINHSCQYCVNRKVMNNGDILCSKKGIVGKDFKCSKYRYDIFTRKPRRPKNLDTSSYDISDFSL